MTEEMPLTALHLLILTPESILFEGPVEWAEIPLVDGWIGIGPNHAPLVAALGQGEVRFAQKGEQREIPIAGGILRISQEICAVLTGSLADETAEQAKAPEALASHLEDALYEVLTPEEIEALQE
ncbi:MAG: hypothetical protein H5T70_02800 [Chloroflexi bacterium]|nr:hypothetical protein [Chloroflexota bacterium]